MFASEVDLVKLKISLFYPKNFRNFLSWGSGEDGGGGEGLYILSWETTLLSY